MGIVLVFGWLVRGCGLIAGYRMTYILVVRILKDECCKARLEGLQLVDAPPL